MAYSPPASDAGYHSSGSSPWMGKGSHDKFGERDVLLQMDGDTSSESVNLESPTTTRSSRLSAPGGLRAGQASSRAASSLLSPTAAKFTAGVPYWLTLYFFFNLSLTLYNKTALVSFPFPWSLTCIHSFAAAVGSYICYRRGYFQRSVTLGKRDNLILVAYSSLYTINIAVSNLSLNLVSVPLHQVVRSTTPLFTILISILFLQKSYLPQIYLSLIPVILGVCLATYGDYSFTVWGLCLTFLGALLAAIKGIATNRILVGKLKFHPLDLLLRMSPLAFAQCLVMSFCTGEMSQIYHRTFVIQTLTRGQWSSLFVNGLLAFGLNVVSFTANKKTGALTMSVAANVKQVLTIVLAVMIFNLHINGVNLLGISSTIAGGAYYSYIEYKSKKSSASTLPSQPVLPTSDASLLSEKHQLSNDNPFLANLHKEKDHPLTPSSAGEKEVYHRKTGSLQILNAQQYAAVQVQHYKSVLSDA